MTTHEFPVQIYYEDTDHSGVVYHANFLKYFERAREHMFGVQQLVDLYHTGVGFVVYQVNLKYLKGAQFGDTVIVKSTVKKESAYRLIFQQNAYTNQELIVTGELQLACVDEEKRLVALPESVIKALQKTSFYEE